MSKIKVKNMDIVSLSNYNVASVEMVRLNKEKVEELAPLKAEKAQILEQRAKALEVEGANLDDVLREFSTDKVEMQISAVNYKYSQLINECVKAQNKVLRLVNPNLFYAYCVSMDSMDSLFKATGEFTYIKNNGDAVTVKIGKNDTYFNCIKSVYEQLGATNTEDEKAMAKVIQFHAKRIGGLKFDRKNQILVFKKKTELTNGLVRDIISYLEVRGFITVAEDGTITKVQ